MAEPLFEVKVEKESKDFAQMIFSPLEHGYGNTLGTALRRVLLTSLPGVAITSVRISGVKHEFSTLSGMKEDIVDFILNLKLVRFSYQGDEPVRITLSAKGAGEIRAGDVNLPATVKIANPELVLAILNKGAKLEAEMQLEVGTGYSSADERERTTLGLIPIDASFSPIRRVNYKVEETRVGRLTNYDKLIMEIWTDGTILAKDAVLRASKILVSYFNQIISPKKEEKKEEKQEDTLGQVGKLSVEELGLPTRVANALAKAGYETVESLVKASREDLMKVRNLGEKSLQIVSAALFERGVKI